MSGLVLDTCRILFPAVMAFAAASDLLTMRISNKIPLLLLVGFVVLAIASGLPARAMAVHVAVAAATLVLAFGCFSMGWIGGGDAKLAAGIALWLGYEHTGPFLIYASLLGGALTFVIMQYRIWALPPLLARQEWAVRLHTPSGGVPYGIALALGALLVYPHSALVTQSLGAG